MMRVGGLRRLRATGTAALFPCPPGRRGGAPPARQLHAPSPPRSLPAGGEAGGDAGGDVPELVAWVLSRGGRVDGATLANLAGRDGGSGWGLKATQDCPAGARLIELPRGCMLSYDPTACDPRLMALIQQVPEELWGGRLALALLAHRAAGGSSPFASYVAHLPRGFPGVPMFFSREAIEAIDYPPVVEQVKKRCRWLHRFSTDALAPLPGGPADPFGGATVDINSLGWGLAAVTSRAFRVRGPSHPAALLPLIDMANHSFEPNAEVLPADGGGVVMVAKRELSAGEPLLLSYGPLSNDFLLMDYGFIVPGNPHDRVAVRFDVNLLNAGAAVANVMDGASFLELDASPAWKRRVLADLNLAGQGADLGVQVGGPHHVDSRLLAATRALAAKYQSEVEGRSTEQLGDWERPLNRQNEVAALKTLLGVCSVLLSNFKTSLDDDAQLLGASGGQQQQKGSSGGGSGGGAPLGEELRAAVQFRAERKRVLLRAVQGLSARARAVAAMPGLREGPAGAGQTKKGERPPPASSRGFAAGGGGNGNGKPRKK